MSKGVKPRSRARRATYHHGALREALLEGARQMLGERGEAGFSLNELARRLGVSTAAPYRHFADRDALFFTLAEEGYRLFGERLVQAGSAAAHPGDAIHRLGVAYLAFAEEQRAYFEVMFHGRAGRVSPTGPATFQLLVDAVAQAQRSGHLPGAQAPAVLARSIWAVLHGLAVLDARAGFTKLGLGAPREQLVAEALAGYLRQGRGSRR